MFLHDSTQYVWDDPYLLRLEQIISCGDVLPKMEKRQSCGIVTIHHMVDTSTKKERLKKFINPGFIGLHYSKMHMHIVNIVKIAKRQVEFQERMRCCKASLKLKYLIVGGLILLVHFHLHIQMNTSWLRLTTRQNG